MMKKLAINIQEIFIVAKDDCEIFQDLSMPGKNLTYKRFELFALF